MLKRFQKLFWAKRVEATLIAIGSAFTLSIIVTSGIYTSGGLVFFGVHWHDTLWHLSLARSIGRLSIENPVFAGETLYNYHYFANIIIAVLALIFGWLNATFRVYPFILAISLGVLTVSVSDKLFKNNTVNLWALFFVYFGSNFNFLLPLFNLGNNYWETSTWVQQQISMFTNLPLATVFVLILAAIYSLILYLEKPNLKKLILTGILFGILPIAKAQSVMVILGLLIAAVYRLFLKKKLDLFFVFLISIVVILLTFVPILKNSDSFIFEPGYFLISMMASPDRVNWPDWILRIEHYKSVDSYHYLIYYWGMAFVIFFFGNVGTRLLAIFSIKNVFENLHEVHVLVVTAASASAIFPLLFLTPGIAWNSIQFFYIYLFLLSFYAAYGAYQISKNNMFLIVLIITLTIPVNINTLYKFHSQPASLVRFEELNAIKFINNNVNNKIVLTYPFKEDFVYLSALTNNSLYLGDKLMAEVPGHDYMKRLDSLNLENLPGVDYVYSKNHQIQQNYLKEIYNKGNIYIYEKI